MLIQIITSTIIGILIGGVIFYYLNKWFTHRKAVNRAEYAQAAEKEAEELLIRNGYRIIERQSRANIVTIIDGKEHFGYAQADFIVDKDKKTYVVEVKAGPNLVDANEPAIRRQLIEYDHVYNPDGLLLVDMSEGVIHHVAFKFPNEAKSDRFISYFIIAAVILIFVAIIWLFIKLRLL